MLEERIRAFKRQIQESRFRLSHMYRELASPLYEMTYVATKEVWRISTNGSCIYFDPNWLSKLSVLEIDFILSHITMHIKLGHIDRPAYYYGDRFHMAADVVANGKLSTYGWNLEKIPHIGRIRYETFLPCIHGSEITSIEAIKCMPFDPSVLPAGKRRQLLIDSEEWWDRKDDRGESGTIVLRVGEEDPSDLEYDGPTFCQRFLYKVEKYPFTGGAVVTDGSGTKDEIKANSKKVSREEIKRAIHSLRQGNQSAESGIDEGNDRKEWENIDVKVLDWRSLLHSFVQEELNDYSFTPPDRRVQESGFFLPDYNVYSETVKDVYFMVDTSGSIPDETLNIAYAEICQALDQFNGNLRGVVGFFDTIVHGAKSFSNVEDIVRIKPIGGGGTDYDSIFEFIQETNAVPPTSIVIITDGEGAFPNTDVANSVPVLWLMTKDNKAPWGKSVYVGK